MTRHWVEDPNRTGRRYDEQLSPLLAAILAAGWDSVAAIDCPYDGPTDVESIRERNAGSPAEVGWQAFGAVAAVSRDRRRHFSRTCRELWERISGSRELQEGLRFAGVPVFPALREVLQQAVVETLPRCMAIRDQARTTIERAGARGLIATYETGPYPRALLIEAARAGIPTVGPQHGMILDNHYDYMHVGVGPDPQLDPFTIPRPTCVWGEFWKRALTEDGHYPAESVQVTGSWRYDAAADDGGRSGAGAARSAAEDGRPLVLVCSCGSGARRSCAVAAAARSIGAAPPSDQPTPLGGPGRHRRALYGRTGRTGARQPRGRLADVLAAASIVVSQLSTVISEAVLADRPVIVADFARQEGWSAYKDSDACLVLGPASSRRPLVAACASIDSDLALRE